MMKLSTYNKLRPVMSSCRSRRQIEELAAQDDFKSDFKDIPLETLTSIYSLELQKMMKRKFPQFNQDTKKHQYRASFFERTKAGEKNVIIHMANEMHLSPCMLIRFILDVHMLELDPDKYGKPKARARAITEILKKPYNVKNRILATAINQATAVDDIFGPYADSVRRCVGLEFEHRLKAWCKEQKIDFQSEDDMRKAGYEKTPDVKLVVPVALDGFVVNWIESKAMFGDMDGHTKHVREQIAPYIRRFGPGLVIYWFGYVDALDCQRDNGVALAEGVPTRVTRFDPTQWFNNPEWSVPKAAFPQPEMKGR